MDCVCSLDKIRFVVVIAAVSDSRTVQGHGRDIYGRFWYCYGWDV